MHGCQNQCPGCAFNDLVSQELVCPQSVLNFVADASKRAFLIDKSKSARGGTRTRMPFGIRPSNVRVCHSTTRAIRRISGKTFRRAQRLASLLSTPNRDRNSNPCDSRLSFDHEHEYEK